MKRIAAIIVFAAISVTALAQGTAMDFIRADRNPETLGLAGAGYVSFKAGTALAAFGNPAIVPYSTELDYAVAGVFGVAPSGEARALIFGGGGSARFGSFGVSAGYLGTSYPEIALSSEGGGASGHSTPKDMLAAVGLSYGIGEHFSIGATGRYATETLDAKTTLSSFSADVIAMYSINSLRVAAGVAGLGPKVKSVSNRSYALPSSAKLAAAYRLGFGDFAAEFMADADYYFNENLSIAGGVQGSYMNMFFLRTGYRYSSSKGNFSAAPVPSMFTVGAGVKLYGISFDVAYVAGGPLMAGLGYCF